MFVEKFRKLCINEKVVLEDNLMSVESARSLYYILRNNNNFYSLNLSKNNLQDEGLKIITELMRDNTSICHLDISSNVKHILIFRILHHKELRNFLTNYSTSTAYILLIYRARMD